MSKSDKLYKIFMTSMIVIIAGLLLATGIIAIQKSMKMNLSFEANPNYLFEVYIQKSGDDTKKLVFRNYEKSASEGVVMENGFSTLYGNTLSADDTFLETYGSDFEFIIENHTKNSGMRVSVTANSETEGGYEGVLPTITEDKMTATKLKEGSTADYIRFGVTTTEVVFPQTTVLNIVFSEHNEYAVGVSPSSGNFTYTANPVAIKGEDYTANVKAHDGYTLTISITNDGGTTILTQGTHYTWNSSTGALTIYASAVTGDITIYAQWERLYTITFTSTTNNLQVNSINGTTITNITSLKMTKSETKNVVVTSTTTEQWSRAVTCSVTSGSANVSLDKFTGDLTITNPTADTTINVSVSDSDTFRPWTYGTYVDSGASTVGTQVTYNTVYYPAFKGYKYIKFQNTSEITTTNYDGTTQTTVPLRWIAIGAGANVNTIFTETNANVPTGDGVDLGKDLGADQVLVLSEKLFLQDSFDDNDNNGSEDSGVDLADWNDSTLKAWLNGDTEVTGASSYNNGTYFLDATGLSTYVANNYIATTTTKTADRNVRKNTSLENDNGCPIFLLAHYYDNSSCPAYGLQNYMIQTYLGAAGTSKYIGYLGTTATYWWLRSGYDGSMASAYSVRLSGAVTYFNVEKYFGVRPSFILNLA